MGKKRTGGGKPFGHQANIGQDEFDETESKILVNTWEDVADSEDEFHISRDKILLEEEPAQKRRRIAEERAAQYELSDEEVLAITESDEIDEDDCAQYSDDEEQGPTHTSDERFNKVNSLKQLKKNLRSAGSDEEVADDSESDEGWGTRRGNYYNTDAVITEADAAAEEAEVKKLQLKQLEEMTEADFDFDEGECERNGLQQNETSIDHNGHSIVREDLPKFEVTDSMSYVDRMAILRLQYPEFEPLTQEFLALQLTYQTLKAQVSHMVLESSPSRLFTLGEVRYRSLGAYLSAIAVYLSLLCSDSDTTATVDSKPMTPEKLKDHDIMASLVQSRDTWEAVKDLNTVEDPVDDSVSSNNDVEISEEDRPCDFMTKPQKTQSKSQQRAALVKAKLAEHQAARIQETEARLADLDTLLPRSSSPDRTKTTRTRRQSSISSSSSIGDPTSLSAHDRLEKARRKKSLQFYTSQIAKKSVQSNGSAALSGGDLDIPRRERLRDRQDRLNREAENRGRAGRGNSNTALDSADSDADDLPTTASRRSPPFGSKDDNDDYYSQVVRQTIQKREDKKALAAVNAQARAEGGLVRVIEDDTIAADGKRAITYTIEKNKGLTPHRKKDVRNPRVKKRRKYEEKLKKLKSTRAVYGGGEEKSGYAGERTGIKTGLVKGTRL